MLGNAMPSETPSNGLHLDGEGIKQHILPLLLAFVIPALSFWFFGHAENRVDADIRSELLADIQKASDLPEEEQQALTKFYESIEVSEVMASSDPEMAELQYFFEPAALRYATFRWGKRISIACLGASLLALLLVGSGAAWSLRSQKALYLSLRTGWPILRTIAAIQVLAQSALVVALSYWITALWMGFYSIYLIGLFSTLAIGAVALMYRAMLFRYEPRLEQSGELLQEDRGQAMWARVREIASDLGTSPPDQIIVGTDASFYVTESPTWLDNSQLTGRTLFVGLPLLKLMNNEEAEAVLGHEMAHFSGEDTMWAPKIAPLLTRMQIYLAHLSESPLALPVYHFLLFFWKVYQFSSGKMSRLREFRADKIGADTSSSSSLSKSLIKVASYCEYRMKMEEEVILKEEVASRPDMAKRLEQGFPEYFSDFTKKPESTAAETSHPFDTHPPLADRIQAVGHSINDIIKDPDLLKPPTRSWYGTISNAAELEEELWNKEERLLMEAREATRAMTLLPITDEEHQLVAKHFPEISFENSKAQAVIINHTGVQLPGNQDRLLFEHIILMDYDDSMGQKQLILTCKSHGSDDTKTHKFKPLQFKNPDENLLDTLSMYYGRHKQAEMTAEADE